MKTAAGFCFWQGRKVVLADDFPFPAPLLFPSISQNSVDHRTTEAIEWLELEGALH